MRPNSSLSTDITHIAPSQYPDCWDQQIYAQVFSELDRLGWPEKGISDHEYQKRSDAGTLSKQGPGIMYRRIMIVLRKYDIELGKRFTLLELEQKIPGWIQQLHTDPQSRIRIVLNNSRSGVLELLRSMFKNPS